MVKSQGQNPDWRKRINTESIHNRVKEFYYKAEQRNKARTARGCQIERAMFRFVLICFKMGDKIFVCRRL